MSKCLAVTAVSFHHLCISYKISHGNFKELIIRRFRVPLPINKADFLEGKLTTRWPSGNDLKVKFNFKILKRAKSVQVMRAVSFSTHGSILELSQSCTIRRKCL